MTTSALPDTLSANDTAQMQQLVQVLHDSYQERLLETTREFHRAQRTVNRLSHEMTRLERHLERINAVRMTHNIPLHEDEKGA